LHPSIDAAAIEQRTCSGFLGFCAEAEPLEPLAISSPTLIDTDGPQCALVPSYGTKYCVIVATDITIDAPLRATGGLPLVLLAKRSIVTTALIDVASRFATPLDPGAGADPSVCDPGTAATPSGAGAGGSFLGRGGDGGRSGIAGAPVAYAAELRGGCPGQPIGGGGHGGGAVFLSAVQRIVVGGGINASGAGSYGGGGSGGMIGLEAPEITATSLLLASGGGGGGNMGAENANGPAPGHGADPSSTVVAAGGTPGYQGAKGGDGSSSAAASPGMPGAYGGGGAGLIKAPSGANLGNQVSPAPTP
jgi:hypothetical protein